MEDFDAAFETWVAQRVQAWWKGRKQKQSYAATKASALLIQRSWRAHKSYKESKPDLDAMARRIQRSWGRFSSVRIFKYYRDLIRFRERGDPNVLLKSINPKEANLSEAAAGVHVRFRLGGTTFPPLVFYKIFTHRPVADMCSFSPKDYTQAGAKSAAEQHNHPKPGQGQFQTTEGWYQRVENNGWRPICDRVLVGVDPVTQMTAAKRYTFHFNPGVRREERLLRKKQKQREWMMRLYRQGMQGEGGGEGAGGATSKHPFPGADREGLFGELPPWDGEGEPPDDVDDLLMWSSSLDFEAYQNDWTSLATSGGSELGTGYDYDTLAMLSLEREARVAAESGAFDPSMVATTGYNGPFVTSSHGATEIPVG